MSSTTEINNKDTTTNIGGSFESLNNKSLSNLTLCEDLNLVIGQQQLIKNQLQSSASLNEKVAQLASSIYTELEKIVKIYGRDIVKDLMSIVVNILEALDSAYHEKEELLVENELLKDDYEKLLMQYEREKQARKDTELKLFQSEDTFAEQKRDYEDKVKSLESIVRMIDLKSKNTSDHVLRLEEKENELKKEYNKLHERYTELFKTHCDYLERTKILFGQDTVSNNPSNTSIQQLNKSNFNNNLNTNLNLKPNKLYDLLKSSGSNQINRNELINCLKSLNKTEINSAVSLFLTNELSSSQQQVVSTNESQMSINSSLNSLNSNQQQQQITRLQQNDLNKSINDLNINNQTENCLNEDTNELDNSHRNKINLQSSENFDEHINSNLTEFEDNVSDIQNNLNKNSNDLDTEFEQDEETLAKNDLSLFNELSRENYDVTELDDGADLTGMTREVANLIRENSELMQTKHALNVLKDDLIVRLDQFSSEMLILREEIKSLQTVKAALQLRISELEEESKKSKEELAQKNKKLEEDDENIPMSQRKRFTRAEMARVLMERNQYKERLMDLQEAVRWTEMIRASKQDQNQPNGATSNEDEHHHSSSSTNQTTGSDQQKKKSTLWRIFSDLFGTSSQQQQQQQQQQQLNNSQSNESRTNSNSTLTTSLTNPELKSPSSKAKLTKASSSHKDQNQVVPLNDQSESQTETDLKITKAYEFLNEPNSQNLQKNSAPKLITKKELESIREDGRMQAYGWSLPTSKTTNNQTISLGLTVPVPVYCRPLFKDENSLKLSCASIVNYSFDQLDNNKSNSLDILLEKSKFSNFKSSNNSSFKSSCIWICNFNDNDTHISIFDANRPGDLIQQFTLKSLKIHSILSVTGVTREDLTDSEIKVSDDLINKNFESGGANIQINKEEINDNLDNITYIEVDNETHNQFETDLISQVNEVKNKDESLSTIYPTMWLGSQEGLLLVHSSITNVHQTIDKIKLKDAILAITQIKSKVIIGLADGSLVIFQRNFSTYEWDLKNFYIINFDNAHHSIRCIQNVNQFVWSGCRNKIYVLDPNNVSVQSVIEVHPRKENQVRHMSCVNDGVWVSIRLDSTLRLYHAKTYQHLQYLDIEPFITRMLGTSNLGLSLVRISSMLIANKRLWIGTGNGVVLSIPFSSNINESQTIKSVPGQVVRINDDKIPYCNLVDSQFSFHGHRDAIKFFLSVPTQAIQKSIEKSTKSYEKLETMLLLSGGHGYIDFRIGDNNTNIIEQIKNSSSSSPINNDKLNDIKTIKANDSSNTLKNDRSHLIVWQIND